MLQCNAIHYEEPTGYLHIYLMSNVKVADDHQKELCWKRGQMNRTPRDIRLRFRILFDIFQSLRLQLRENSSEGFLQGARRLL